MELRVFWGKVDGGGATCWLGKMVCDWRRKGMWMRKGAGSHVHSGWVACAWRCVIARWDGEMIVD